MYRCINIVCNIQIFLFILVHVGRTDAQNCQIGFWIKKHLEADLMRPRQNATISSGGTRVMYTHTRPRQENSSVTSSAPLPKYSEASFKGAAS